MRVAHLFLVLAGLWAGVAGQRPLRLGVPQHGAVGKDRYQITAFPLVGLPKKCDLIFSLTVLSGHARLFARDPTSWPMPVWEAHSGLIHIPPRQLGRAVYLLQVVGDTDAEYALLAYCAAQPVQLHNGVPARLLCLEESVAVLHSNASLAVSLASLTPVLSDGRSPLRLRVTPAAAGVDWQETRSHAALGQLQALTVAPNQTARRVEWRVRVRCTAPTALVLYGVADGARVRLGPGAPFTGVLAPGATQYFGKAPAAVPDVPPPALVPTPAPAADTPTPGSPVVRAPNMGQAFYPGDPMKPDDLGGPAMPWGPPQPGSAAGGPASASNPAGGAIPWASGWLPQGQAAGGTTWGGSFGPPPGQPWGGPAGYGPASSGVQPGAPAWGSYGPPPGVAGAGAGQPTGGQQPSSQSGYPSWDGTYGPPGMTPQQPKAELATVGRWQDGDGEDTPAGSGVDRHRRRGNRAEAEEDEEEGHPMYGGEYGRRGRGRGQRRQEQDENEYYRSKYAGQERRRGAQQEEQEDERERGRGQQEEDEGGEPSGHPMYGGEYGSRGRRGRRGQQEDENEYYRRKYGNQEQYGPQQDQEEEWGDERGGQRSRAKKEPPEEEEARSPRRGQHRQQRQQQDENEYYRRKYGGQEGRQQQEDENEYYRRKYGGQKGRQQQDENEYYRHKYGELEGRQGPQKQHGRQGGPQSGEQYGEEYGEQPEQREGGEQPEEERREGRWERRQQPEEQGRERRQQQRERRQEEAERQQERRQEKAERAREAEEERQERRREAAERVRERREEAEERERERRQQAEERRREGQERRQERRQEAEERQRQRQRREAERQRQRLQQGETGQWEDGRDTPLTTARAWHFLYSEAAYNGSLRTWSSLACADPAECPAEGELSGAYAPNAYGELAVQQPAAPVYTAVQCDGGDGCAYTLALAGLPDVQTLEPGATAQGSLSPYNPKAPPTAAVFRLLHPVRSGFAVVLEASAGADLLLLYSPVLTNVDTFPVAAATGRLDFPTPARVGAYYLVVKALGGPGRYRLSTIPLPPSNDTSTDPTVVTTLTSLHASDALTPPVSVAQLHSRPGRVLPLTLVALVTMSALCSVLVAAWQGALPSLGRGPPRAGWAAPARPRAPAEAPMEEMWPRRPPGYGSIGP